MNKNKVMLVDGMALLFRSFYATAVSGYFMVNSKGVPTNAIHGFIRHLFLAINHHNPTHVVCCWDMGSQTFRNEIYPDYKANRGAAPEELIPQFDLVKEVVKELNIPNIGLVGYEADDCIGTLAKQISKDIDVIILTGDQDLLQLATEQVSVCLLKKGHGNYQLCTSNSIYEEKGITAHQLIDIKALMGDSSDNYPGVKGIGEKTALMLIKKYDTIEGILENLHLLTPSQRKNIERDLDILHLCRKLAMIHCEVDVSWSIEAAILDIDHTKMITKFEELELRNLNGILDVNKEEIETTTKTEQLSLLLD